MANNGPSRLALKRKLPSAQICPVRPTNKLKALAGNGWGLIFSCPLYVRFVEE